MRQLRVLTWNVNGLRPCASKYGGIAKMLAFLNADIICFQEHKMRRCDLDRELALVDGWESFFTFSHKNTGYSGVATYCKRIPGLLPTHAEEGLTGVMSLQPAHRAQLLSDPRWQGLTVADLVAMDQEGRVMITHHDGLIVINVYGVAITNEETAEERKALKIRIFKALESRVRQFLAAGSRVLIVGDFNICPKPIDHRQPETLDEQEWCGRDSVAWLHRFSWDGPKPGGPLVDTFRMFHPGRTQAFTCWSVATGGRVNNWGSRIDLLLAAGPGAVLGQEARDSVGSWVVAGDIWPEVQGSDHAPAWTQLLLPLCNDTATATAEGSSRSGAGTAGALPPPLPLSTRSMFAPVKQVKLTQWVGKATRQQPGVTDHDGDVDASDRAGGAAIGADPGAATGAGETAQPGADVVRSAAADSAQQPPQPGPGTGWAASTRPNSTRGNSTTPQASGSAVCGKKTSANGVRASSSAGKSGGGAAGSTQATLTAFLKVPVRSHTAGCSSSAGPACGGVAGAGSSQATYGSAPVYRCSIASDGGREGWWQVDEANGACDVGSAQGWEQAAQQGTHPGSGISSAAPAAANAMDRTQAKEAWKAIQNRMKPPNCTGHNEPAVIRQVKKSGPNLGRLFHVCARPDGPPPQGRCDFFQWADNRVVAPTGRSGGKTSGGGGRGSGGAAPPGSTNKRARV